MSVRLRVCGPRDYPALLGIVDDPDVAFDLFPGMPPPAMFYVRPDAGSGAGPVFVAESTGDGRVVGGGRIEQGGFSYFVRRTEWRQGYGTRIAELMLIEHRRRHPSRPAVLAVKRENPASIRIVERLGFRFAGLVGRDPVMLKFVSGPDVGIAVA